MDAELALTQAAGPMGSAPPRTRRFDEAADALRRDLLFAFTCGRGEGLPDYHRAEAAIAVVVSEILPVMLRALALHQLAARCETAHGIEEATVAAADCGEAALLAYRQACCELNATDSQYAIPLVGKRLARAEAVLEGFKAAADCHAGGMLCLAYNAHGHGGDDFEASRVLELAIGAIVHCVRADPVTGKEVVRHALPLMRRSR